MAQQTIDLAHIRQEVEYDDHLIALDSLYSRYNTNPKLGLAPEEVKMRLLRDGPNTLLRVKGTPWWKLLLNQMFGVFPCLLWVAAILCIINAVVETHENPAQPKDDLYLGILIITVIVVSGLFGFFQERRSSNIMNSFLKMTQPTTRVLRAGKTLVIPADKVVVGDVLLLNVGDCVPADVRVVECHGAKVDASPLTGESEPCALSVRDHNREPLRSPNIAFFSTYLTEGSMKGVVFRTGTNTYIGKVAALTATLHAGETAVDKDIHRFVKMVLGVAIVFNIVLFVVTQSIGYRIVDSVVFALGMLVANVPEALPITVTVSLSLTAKRMAQKNCLVKTLKAVVMLGSTSVICSDKTGTLTMNRMTVVGVWYNKKEVDVTTRVPSAKDVDFHALIQAAILCNRAYFEAGHVNKALGDASESAIIVFVQSKVGSVEGIRAANRKVYEEAFTSAKKYQITVHRNTNSFLLAVKGAPEKVLDMCDKMLVDGKETNLTKTTMREILDACEDMASRGQRVLGVARADMAMEGSSRTVDPKTIPRKGLVLLGFMALSDPPRESVPRAVAMCRQAGIKIIMVTGDHPTTAAAIAKEVGIFSMQGATAKDIAAQQNIDLQDVSSDDTPRLLMTGSDLAAYNIETLAPLIQRFPEIVFARTSPTQKLLIVESVQSLGSIVAVTGDGVNDSPALKKADVGVAMGINGTDVAKEAADIILLDDNFASIVAAVEQGRIIFDNLQKSIAYVLSSNTPEMVPFLLQVILGIPPPLTMALVMLIDAGTDVWPSIALAYEAGEKDVMKRRPRDHSTDPLVTDRLMFFAYLQVGVLQAAAAMVSYYIVMMDHGFWPGDLLYMKDRWLDADEIVVDSYGKAWTEPERVVLTQTAQSSVYLAIAWTQLADTVICRSRRDSMVSRSWTTWQLHSAFFIQILFAGLVVYCPGADSVVRTQPVAPIYWIPAIIFSLMLLLLDELRRWYIRHHPRSRLERDTYY